MEGHLLLKSFLGFLGLHWSKGILKFIESKRETSSLPPAKFLGPLGYLGIWVERPDKPKNVDGFLEEEKIAAIGVRLKKWVTLHGLSINVDPDLDA